MRGLGLGKKENSPDVEGSELWLWRRARESRIQRVMHKENISLKTMAWEMRGADFCKFLQSAGLKAWNFKAQGSWIG